MNPTGRQASFCHEFTTLATRPRSFLPMNMENGRMVYSLTVPSADRAKPAGRVANPGSTSVCHTRPARRFVQALAESPQFKAGLSAFRFHASRAMRQWMACSIEGRETPEPLKTLDKAAFCGRTSAAPDCRILEHVSVPVFVVIGYRCRLRLPRTF